MKTLYPLTLYYDGACPVCALEMAQLRARDAHGRLRFVDIAAPAFIADPAGPTLAEMNAAMHAQRADGTWLRGLEALRLAYLAAGLGAWMEPTGWWPIRPLADAGYRLFARHRRSIARAAKPLIAAIAALRALRSRRRIARCTGLTRGAASRCES